MVGEPVCAPSWPAVPTCETDLPELVDRVRSLIVPGERRILGITGAPGAGKSTVAQHLAAALGHDAALVGMDGFHLANTVLRDLGRLERKGSIDTFDAAGYVALLRRLRKRPPHVVYAPEFHRDIEESIACAIPVAEDVPLVITEGNYLLAEDQPWAQIRELADAIWHLELPYDVRIGRLTVRHERFGRSAADAAARALGSDQLNADLVEACKGRADLIVRMH